MNKDISFAQLGRRYDYKYAEIISKFGYLNKLYTDFWTPFNLKGNKLFSNKLFHRNNINIPFNKIQSYNILGLKLKYDLSRCSNIEEISIVLSKYGNLFSNAINRHINSDIFIGMSSECLEILSKYKELNKKTILIQYDSADDEFCFSDEKDKFPFWENVSFNRSNLYYKRVYAEWEFADKIVVNSQWAKNLIQMQGAIESKIEIVPIVFDSNIHYKRDCYNMKLPLRVLYVGSIVLRKGVQYLLEAAKNLPSDSFEFHFIGPSLIDLKLLKKEYPKSIFYGSLNQNILNKMYPTFDILVFPSLSDGFGTVQLEAMSYGLPVIATPCCGDVVRDGIDGFIIPPKNYLAIEQRLILLNNDRIFLMKLSENAKIRSSHFSLENISKKFLKVIN